MKPLQRFETNAGRVIYSFPVRSFPTLTNNIYVIDDGRQYVLIYTAVERLRAVVVERLDERYDTAGLTVT